MNPMNDKLSISIDCTGERPHAISAGNNSKLYANLEDLADDLECILETEEDCLLQVA